MRIRPAHITLLVVLLLGTADALAQGVQKPVTVASPASYDELVKKLQAGDLSIDFLDLRMKYAASPQYEPEEGSTEFKDMYGKLNAKDYDGALKIANAVLAKQYVNIDAHIVASEAYDALHNDAQAKLHHDIVVALAHSILDNARGASTADAYKVISVEEEYALMRILGLRLGKQSYLHEGTRSYDQMELTDPKDSSTVVLYFDVTLSDQQTEKALHN